ncbi:MAG TPA: DUF5667 domain-containing protein [Candidatus Binatia bacterium]|nr:DUF5667 domain-containing protein [Candidatus Binatia bacterium]
MEGVLEEEIIESALEQLELGLGVEDILEHYPGQEAELRAILETAAGLSDLPPLPSAGAQETSRRRLLAEAKRLREASRPEQNLSPWRRFYYSIASVAVFLFLLGVIVIPPSRDAIPGDILYPVKRSEESLQLYLATAEEKEMLREEYEEERNHEVYEMIEIGRDGRAGYVGILEGMAPDRWEIGHITALIDDATVINGDPEVGARIQAHCYIKDGRVIAESLTVLEPPVTIGPPQDD